MDMGIFDWGGSILRWLMGESPVSFHGGGGLLNKTFHGGSNFIHAENIIFY